MDPCVGTLVRDVSSVSLQTVETYALSKLVQDELSSDERASLGITIPIEGVPEWWTRYNPTLLEWLVTSGTLAATLLLITLMVRYLPIIPITETAEERGIQLETSKNIRK